MHLVRNAMLALALGVFAVACGADESADTTPASNDNEAFRAGAGAEVGVGEDGAKANVEGEVEAGDVGVKAGTGAEVDVDDDSVEAGVGGTIEAGDIDDDEQPQQPPPPQPQDPNPPQDPEPQPAPTPPEADPNSP